VTVEDLTERVAQLEERLRQAETWIDTQRSVIEMLTKHCGELSTNVGRVCEVIGERAVRDNARWRMLNELFRGVLDDLDAERAP
jgi:uncharacterized protein with von Willebrand factor type A (vWA) domain